MHTHQYPCRATTQIESLQSYLNGNGIRTQLDTHLQRLEALEEWVEWVYEEDRDMIIVSRSRWIDVTDWSLEHVRIWLGY